LKLAHEQRDEFAVSLDCAYRPSSLCEQRSKRTRPCAYFNNARPTPFLHGHARCRDIACNGSGHEKILTKCLLWSQPSFAQHTLHFVDMRVADAALANLAFHVARRAG
jgi:hypothetical protein